MNTAMWRRVRQSLLLLTLIWIAPRLARAQDAPDLKADKLPANAIWLESLDVRNMTQDFGSPRARRSVDRNPLTLQGVVYPHGIGTHARSEMIIDLKGVATRFLAMVGVDDEKKGYGSVTFTVLVDGKKAAETAVLHGGDKPQLLSVDLQGAKKMTLRVGDGGDGIDSDHADWAGALLILAEGATVKPTAATVPIEPPRLVVPPPDPKPALHGARITGATPGKPFLFQIPVTGERPITFTAKNLPAGLTLDTKTGLITGALQAEGTTVVQLTAANAQGKATRSLTVVGGKNRLALTPPMGWNSWNCWANAVDDGKVRASAQGMVKSGLREHGFQYINIDDCWEGGRDAEGNIQTNQKFPDMKALCDYVHSLGLKIGVYSSPGPKTCAGFTASYQHEEQDARSYARWGFDYLKYDWCSYGGIAKGNSLPELQKPYFVMRDALAKADRDIVFSLCQYGMGKVWEWGAEVGGNCWRTTGDITDSWGSLHNIYNSQDGHEKYAGPGHWNDPDMLIVGKVGWGNPHPSRLTPNEQILHISLWCLLSSPLLIGCDMSDMDPFTVAVLSNDEVLDINQDPLGKPAGRKAMEGSKEVWARPLADGTMAVGLINSGTEAETITADWATLGLKGRQPVRDLWLHKEMGAFTDRVAVSVPAHGAVVLKIGVPKRGI